MDSSCNWTKSTSHYNSNAVQCRALNKISILYVQISLTSTVTELLPLWSEWWGRKYFAYLPNQLRCLYRQSQTSDFVLTSSHPFSFVRGVQLLNLFERSLRGVWRNYQSRDTSATARTVNIKHLTANRVAGPICLKREKCNGRWRRRVNFESGVADCQTIELCDVHELKFMCHVSSFMVRIKN